MRSSDQDKETEIYANLASQIGANREEPLHRQIFSAMERFIEEGRLAPGVRLPPERKLMEILNVSRSTLRVALAELSERRYISATQGRGNFVLEPPRKRPLQILAVERFHPNYWSTRPFHYDWINEGAKAANARIHYHYAPTEEEMQAELLSPPPGYDAIVLFKILPTWNQALLSMPDEVFENSPIPIMLIDRPIRKRGLNVVSWDFKEATRLATRRLIEAGHQRIGFISSIPAPGHTAALYEGYTEAMTEAGLPLVESDLLHLEDPLFIGGVMKPELNEAICEFLRTRGFTAVVPVLVSSAVEQAIIRLGIQLPLELSTVIVSEEHALEQSVFRWSSFLEPSSHVIHHGIQRLADICRDLRRPGVFELIPPQERRGATIHSL